ncbi:MAG: PHP domain-containing protein [Methanomassiliicoccales archaeon]
MRYWQRYSKYLLSGEWHIHTNLTDGLCSIDDICLRARELGIPLIAFTEHIRNVPSYDPHQFIESVYACRNEFPDVIILCGFEVKILEDGEPNADKGYLEKGDYNIFAFHSFPEDKDLYLDALMNAIKNRLFDCWGHPGLVNGQIFPLEENYLRSIFSLMKEREMLLEVNEKYAVPSIEWIPLIREYEVQLVRGSDVHSLEHLSARSMCLEKVLSVASS